MDGSAFRERLVVLLARVERRDAVAFEELYTLCSPSVHGVLLNLLKSEAVAEEALQETFVAIWKQSGSYVPMEDAPMPWMMRIARGQARELLGRRAVRDRRERLVGSRELSRLREIARSLELARSRDVDRSREVVRSGEVDLSLSEANELPEPGADLRHLLACLERLPEATRDCIVRAFCEGYSHEELGAVQGASLDLIRKLVREGLASLEHELDEQRR